MKSIFIILVIFGSTVFNFALAGDLQNLFREVNAELIAQNEQNTATSGFGTMDKSGNITPAKIGTGIKPIRSTLLTLSNGIEEVAIERTPCYGRCSAYTFTVRKDGSFTYLGEQNVEHIGTFTGSLNSAAVTNVFLAIDALDYMGFNYSYSSNVLDAAAVYSKVVKFGEVKVVENYAGVGPGKLLAVELLIDSLVAQINWDEVVDEGSM